MEPVHGELKASKCAAEDCKDFISSMPDNVITKILNRLPLRDVVSTGILSSTWKFKWTLITKLVFDYDLYENFRGWGGKPNGKDLSRLINQLKGPITKFNLLIPDDDGYPDDILFDDEDVNHWLSILSRNGIKKLNIRSESADPHELPTQVFSCLELKHLLLRKCFINLPPSFCGFPKLLNLVLSYPEERSTFGGLISRCPLLEALRIDAFESVHDLEVAEIVKHGNIKILNLSLCVFERITSSSIFHLTNLPKLEKLSLDFGDDEFVADAGVGNKVATTFLSLKTLNISSVDLNDDLMVSFISEMICRSPNLHNLYILAKYVRNVQPRADSDPNTMGMLHLRNVGFACYKSSENEVRFIKSLLACSPLLEKIKIHGSSRAFSRDGGKFMFATKVLMLPRASPTVKVEFAWVSELSYPRRTFGELIARCPLLEALRIDDDESVDDVEVAEIAKRRNLKMLYLALCVLESITSSAIFQLTELPKLEELDLNFRDCEFLADARVGSKFTTTFLSLKTLKISSVDFNDDLMISLISEMICSSPNLHNLYISATCESNVPPPADLDCNTMGMLHLRSVVFSCYEGSENEVRFIKSLLACSPLLEKIKIHGYSSQVFSGDKEKLMFATKLLKLPRASPTAEVDISWD